MKPILLDTNAYSGFKRGVLEAVEIIRYAPLIGISSIVLGELLGGFKRGKQEEKNRRDLRTFMQSERVVVFEADAQTADIYSVIYAMLAQKGMPIPTNDMWIAATAIQYGLALFTYDAHFQGIPGLMVGTTLSELGG